MTPQVSIPVETTPAKDDMEIFREAERKRGGCGAFLVGAPVFFLVLVPTMMGVFPLADHLSPNHHLILVLLCFGCSIAAAIWAANTFTKIRLRLASRKENVKNSS